MFCLTTATEYEEHFIMTFEYSFHRNKWNKSDLNNKHKNDIFTAITACI